MLAALVPAVVAARTRTIVERGYRDDEGLALLLLGLGAAALVGAGTLAATSLALAEARTDFTALRQVGARPRTRRTIGGAYAGVLAAVGAALGVAAGAVPGVAARSLSPATATSTPIAPASRRRPGSTSRSRGSC